MYPTFLSCAVRRPGAAPVDPGEAARRASRVPQSRPLRGGRGGGYGCSHGRAPRVASGVRKVRSPEWRQDALAEVLACVRRGLAPGDNRVQPVERN